MKELKTLMDTLNYTQIVQMPTFVSAGSLLDHIYIKSQVFSVISQCQNEDYKGIEIKSIGRENDPANLRLLEAFYINKYKPTLNSREECSEFADLLF